MRHLVTVALRRFRAMKRALMPILASAMSGSCTWSCCCKELCAHTETCHNAGTCHWVNRQCSNLPQRRRVLQITEVGFFERLQRACHAGHHGVVDLGHKFCFDVAKGWYAQFLQAQHRQCTSANTAVGAVSRPAGLPSHQIHQTKSPEICCSSTMLSLLLALLLGQAASHICCCMVIRHAADDLLLLRLCR